MRNISIVFILLALIVGGVVYWNMADDKPADNDPVVTFSGSDVIVTMRDEGFSPSEFTVKAGQRVVWVNETAEHRWPASNLHPTHQIYPEFDPQEPLAPGERWSLTFTKAGKWYFHDHLRPQFLGTVVVTE